MQEEIEDYLKEIEEVTDLLYKEHFQLSDIGLTSKIAFDWSKVGIYLRERKSKYRRKYNGLEYVWLRLVKELREIGLSIDAIRNLRDYLLTENNFLDHLKSLYEEEELEDEMLNHLFTGMKEVFKTPEELVASAKGHEVELNNTLLSIIVFSTIFSKSNVHLAITKDGNCYVYDESPMEDLFVSSMILNQSYITVPLNHIIAEFIGREDLYELRMSDDIIELTEQEEKILDLIRKGGINSLNIKFVDGEVNLIETEEIVDPKEVKGKMIDLIKKGGYQEITYQTQKGQIVSVKRKTKHK